MTARKTKVESPPVVTVSDPLEIKKAQVSISPPGSTNRFGVINRTSTNPDLINYSRREQGLIYYDMYKQHPVVKAAIDKKAQVCVAGGWQYVASDSEEEVNNRKKVILEKFFRESSGKQLLRLTYRDLFIYGEAFWNIVRSAATARTPMKAYRLNPRFMQPIVSNGFIVGWEYGGPYGKQKYDVAEIMHFKYDDPEDDTRGLSPLHSVQRAVTQDIYAMEYNQNFFANSAQTGIIFITKTSDAGEAARNREWLEANYVGPQNAHKPILLEGDVTVARSVSNAHDMEYLNGRVFNRQEILLALDMDPDKLGIHDNSNRGVSKEASDAFTPEVIWPVQGIVEEEINNRLIDGLFHWDDIMFQHRESDPRRAGEQADLWDKHQKQGRLSVNDVRQRMGLPKIEGGDLYVIMTPAGAIPLTMISEVAELQIQKLRDKSTAGQTPVIDPISGLGTTSTGQQNPIQQDDTNAS